MSRLAIAAWVWRRLRNYLYCVGWGIKLYSPVGVAHCEYSVVGCRQLQSFRLIWNFIGVRVRQTKTVQFFGHISWCSKNLFSRNAAQV